MEKYAYPTIKTVTNSSKMSVKSYNLVLYSPLERGHKAQATLFSCKNFLGSEIGQIKIMIRFSFDDLEQYILFTQFYSSLL